ncbi:hypothetical protein AHiyo8_65710 [Arthrobacter sp. Hiyo8]|nr:hypothetical protein AHiyo8_65710 [Arthrobacter sp. Hiyo8]
MCIDSNSAADRTSSTTRSWCSRNQVSRVSGAKAATVGLAEGEGKSRMSFQDTGWIPHRVLQIPLWVCKTPLGYKIKVRTSIGDASCSLMQQN